MSFNAAAFREIISGQRTDAGARLSRWLLSTLEPAYKWAVERRNRRYDTGQAAIHRVEVPVVSVGNLTLGGTGKTPVVEYLCRRLLRDGWRPAIVSRGYRGNGSANDEARELAQTLPEVPHVQNRDRVAAAREAIGKCQANVIVLDDGFQHRRLHRDLEIVLIDATAPGGYGHLVPRGMLREPWKGLRRADAVILTRSDHVPETERMMIHRLVAAEAPNACWSEVIHAPRSLLDLAGKSVSLSQIRDQPVAAFCGIGNPLGFQRSLIQLGLHVEAFREFPDHHHYRAADFEALTRWAATLRVDALVCTHKDLVKVPRDAFPETALYAVVAQIEFRQGEEELLTMLRSRLRSRQRRIA